MHTHHCPHWHCCHALGGHPTTWVLSLLLPLGQWPPSIVCSLCTHRHLHLHGRAISLCDTTKLTKKQWKKCSKTVQKYIHPFIIYLYIPVKLQYRYTVCHNMPKLTTVPIPSKPVTSYLWVEQHPWQTLMLNSRLWRLSSSDTIICREQPSDGEMNSPAQILNDNFLWKLSWPWKRQQEYLGYSV